MRNHLLIGAAVAALMIPVAASAQETTTLIRGTVTDNGAPVAGATITVTNVPSGTKSTSTTSEDGTFTASGLRAGGPFTIEVVSPTASKTVTDVYTVVGQPYDLPIELAETTTGDIVITASNIKGAGVTSDGPQTVLTQRDISKVASVNRDIRDIERRSPFAALDLSNSRAVSFAGTNPRFNRFTINGVTVGDTFGLNPDASPTGRGPVPYDAIAQVSISIAPFDFRQAGFAGGAIDTVLLSGTNEFKGTAFYSTSTDNLQGKRIGSNVLVVPDYNSKTYGATLSGPIIPDTLFFMVSAERNTDPRPFTPASIGQVPNLTSAQVTNVQGIANTVYGYTTGDVLSINPQKDEKIVGKIDWNITTGQRLSLSYVNAFDSTTALQNTSQTATGPTLGLASNAYATTELLRAGIIQLNSDWTDTFSTEIRGIYRATTRGQEPLLGRGFAQFGVCLDPTATTTPGGQPNTSNNTGCQAVVNSPATVATPRLFFGPDISRQTNTLFYDTWAGSFLARFTLGSHELKFLTEFSENRTTNNFLQYSAGGYYFDSVADLQNRRANQLIYAATLNGQPDGAAADFHYDQWSFGIQDDWKVTDSLTVSYGMRYDLFGQRDQPTINPFFVQRYGFPNTRTYKGLANFQPRISFNWKPINNLRLRGGVGIFGGGNPDIYLSNSFSNTILSNRVTITRNGTTDTCTGGVPNDVCIAALNNVTGKGISPIVQAYAAANTATLTNASTGALDRDFRPPSIVKATLSADYKLFGIDLGADYLFTKIKDAVIFRDARSVQIGTLPDGRPRLGSLTQFADNNVDIILDNTSRGRSHIFVVRAQKDFDFGLSMGGSYTWQNVKDVSPATASTITSNYSQQTFANPLSPAYGTSYDQVKWAFKYNIGFDHAFFGDYRTSIQLFGETRAGRPFSYTMSDTATTTTRSVVFGAPLNSGRYLLYVPTSTNDPIVSYDSATTQATLDSIVNSTNLNKYRGQIAPKNIARSRAFTRIDLHLEQEIPTFIGKSRISLFADIENLPNLLNKNWGGLRQFGFPQQASAVSVQCLSVATPTGTAPAAGVVNTASNQTCVQYRYSAARDANQTPVIASSLYLIRVGARFTF